MSSDDQNPAPSGDDEILPLREPASRLNVIHPTLSCLFTKRRVPALRVGHAWRFRKRDIDEWMANGGTPEDRGADG